jgi:hypothetical protein
LYLEVRDLAGCISLTSTVKELGTYQSPRGLSLMDRVLVVMRLRMVPPRRKRTADRTRTA